MVPSHKYQLRTAQHTFENGIRLKPSDECWYCTYVRRSQTSNPPSRSRKLSLRYDGCYVIFAPGKTVSCANTQAHRRGTKWVGEEPDPADYLGEEEMRELEAGGGVRRAEERHKNVGVDYTPWPKAGEGRVPGKMRAVKKRIDERERLKDTEEWDPKKRQSGEQASKKQSDPGTGTKRKHVSSDSETPSSPRSPSSPPQRGRAKAFTRPEKKTRVSDRYYFTDNSSSEEDEQEKEPVEEPVKKSVRKLSIAEAVKLQAERRARKERNDAEALVEKPASKPKASQAMEASAPNPKEAAGNNNGDTDVTRSPVKTRKNDNVVPKASTVPLNQEAPATSQWARRSSVTTQIKKSTTMKRRLDTDNDSTKDDKRRVSNTSKDAVQRQSVAKEGAQKQSKSGTPSRSQSSVPSPQKKFNLDTPFDKLSHTPSNGNIELLNKKIADLERANEFLATKVTKKMTDNNLLKDKILSLKRTITQLEASSEQDKQEAQRVQNSSHVQKVELDYLRELQPMYQREQQRLSEDNVYQREKVTKLEASLKKAAEDYEVMQRLHHEEMMQNEKMRTHATQAVVDRHMLDVKNFLLKKELDTLKEELRTAGNGGGGMGAANGLQGAMRAAMLGLPVGSARPVGVEAPAAPVANVGAPGERCAAMRG